MARMADLPRFLTLADAAEILNTSSAQVYALVRQVPPGQYGRDDQRSCASMAGARLRGASCHAVRSSVLSCGPRGTGCCSR